MSFITHFVLAYLGSLSLPLFSFCVPFTACLCVWVSCPTGLPHDY